MAWAGAGASSFVLTIGCPACGKPASFRLASALRLHEVEDVERFKALRGIQIVDAPFSRAVALYRQGLGSPPIDSYGSLTETERATLKISTPPPPHEGEGSVLCDSCGLRRAHRVDWPADAYYQIEHRGQVLWAWNRALAEALLRMAETPGMKPQDDPASADFLKRVPTEFFTAKSRDAVAKKLRKRLSEGAV